jgi:hypothetical protein
VTIRQQNGADLANDTRFDLAWLPPPFIPQPAVASALPGAAAAPHLGGWLVLGRSKSGSTPVKDALTWLKARPARST